MFLWKCRRFRDRKVSTWWGLVHPTFGFMPNDLTTSAVRVRHLLSHVFEYWLCWYRYLLSKVNIWNVNCVYESRHMQLLPHIHPSFIRFLLYGFPWRPSVCGVITPGLLSPLRQPVCQQCLSPAWQQLTKPEQQEYWRHGNNWQRQVQNKWN